MGADIHAHVEAWYGPRGEWGNVGEVRILSDYRLFAKLAGVRNGYDIVPICTPRGMPVDADPETLDAAAAYAPDGHTHSWLTLHELQAADWTHDAQPICTAFRTSVLPYMTYLAGGRPAHDVRMVFWFDN